MTTDTTALQERLARAAHQHDEAETHVRPRAWEDEHPERRGEYLALAAAVLPIIAEMMEKAWDEGSGGRDDLRPNPYRQAS